MIKTLFEQQIEILLPQYIELYKKEGIHGVDFRTAKLLLKPRYEKYLKECAIGCYHNEILTKATQKILDDNWAVINGSHWLDYEFPNYVRAIYHEANLSDFFVRHYPKRKHAQKGSFDEIRLFLRDISLELRARKDKALMVFDDLAMPRENVLQKIANIILDLGSVENALTDLDRYAVQKPQDEKLYIKQAIDFLSVSGPQFKEFFDPNKTHGQRREILAQFRRAGTLEKSKFKIHFADVIKDCYDEKVSHDLSRLARCLVEVQSLDDGFAIINKARADSKPKFYYKSNWDLVFAATHNHFQVVFGALFYQGDEGDKFSNLTYLSGLALTCPEKYDSDLVNFLSLMLDELEKTSDLTPISTPAPKFNVRYK